MEGEIKTFTDILKYLRDHGIDTIQINSKEGTESLDVRDSIEQGKAIFKKEDET
jgi:hypothetical protein